MRVRYRRKHAVKPPNVDFWGWFTFLKYFRFLIIPGLIASCLWWFGVPQLRTVYVYRGPVVRGIDPPRYYTRCDYFGLTGWERIHPVYGECPLIRFVPLRMPSWRAARNSHLSSA